MAYNFNQTAKRLHTSSIKWDVKDNELPMWVADMDFLPMPEIQEAISKAAKENAYFVKHYVTVPSTQNSTENKTTAKFCPYCGKQNPGGNFCSGCGAKL